MPEPTPPVIAAHGPVESVPTGTAIALHDQRRSDAIFEVKPRIAQLDSKGGAFNALAFSPDGHLLAAARGDATVLIWETATVSCNRRCTVTMARYTISPLPRMAAGCVRRGPT